MKKIKSPTTSKQIKDGVGLGSPPPLQTRPLHNLEKTDRFFFIKLVTIKWPALSWVLRANPDAGRAPVGRR